MSLRDEIRDITGKKRKFLLLRIADVETATAKSLADVSEGTYNNWVGDTEGSFSSLYRRRDELCADYKHEAIQLLRRDNQLHAVLLEEEIIKRMRYEIANDDYVLIRTNLARDVYAKLVNDLDWQPQAVALTWEQRLQNILVTGGSNAQPTLPEANAGIIIQHTEGGFLTEGEQTCIPIEETTEA